jgi:hypothetical protein
MSVESSIEKWLFPDPGGPDMPTWNGSILVPDVGI